MRASRFQAAFARTSGRIEAHSIRWAARGGQSADFAGAPSEAPPAAIAPGNPPRATGVVAVTSVVITAQVRDRDPERLVLRRVGFNWAVLSTLCLGASTAPGLGGFRRMVEKWSLYARSAPYNPQSTRPPRAAQSRMFMK